MATERVWKFDQNQQVDKLKESVKQFKKFAAEELVTASSISYEDYKMVNALYEGLDSIVELVEQRNQNQDYMIERIDELKTLVERMQKDLNRGK